MVFISLLTLGFETDDGGRRANDDFWLTFSTKANINGVIYLEIEKEIQLITNHN